MIPINDQVLIRSYVVRGLIIAAQIAVCGAPGLGTPGCSPSPVDYAIYGIIHSACGAHRKPAAIHRYVPPGCIRNGVTRSLIGMRGLATRPACAPIVQICVAPGRKPNAIGGGQIGGSRVSMFLRSVTERDARPGHVSPRVYFS